MTIIVITGHVTFWHFIYFGLFNGTVMAISMPTRASVIPDIVDRGALVNAMALQGATFNLARILGPGVAGVLIAAFAAAGLTTTQSTGAVMWRRDSATCATTGSSSACWYSASCR